MRSRLLYAAVATAVTGALAGTGLAVSGAIAQSPVESRNDGGVEYAAIGVAADGSTDPLQVDFAGTVALSNCSGSLVRFAASQPTDPAMALTNGHCY